MLLAGCLGATFRCSAPRGNRHRNRSCSVCAARAVGWVLRTCRREAKLQHPQLRDSAELRSLGDRPSLAIVRAAVLVRMPQKSSRTGTRTRAVWVKTTNPNRLDHPGTLQEPARRSHISLRWLCATIWMPLRLPISSMLVLSAVALPLTSSIRRAHRTEDDLRVLQGEDGRAGKPWGRAALGL